MADDQKPQIEAVTITQVKNGYELHESVERQMIEYPARAIQTESYVFQTFEELIDFLSENFTWRKHAIKIDDKK